MLAQDQSIDEIVAALSPLDVEWMDDVASSVMAKIAAVPRKAAYDREDMAALFEADVNEGVLCARLFLALSKDSMDSALRDALGPGGIGAKRYAADREAFLDALERLGLPEKMAAAVNYQPVWSDILLERLRSGRDRRSKAKSVAAVLRTLLKPLFEKCSARGL